MTRSAVCITVVLPVPIGPVTITSPLRNRIPSSTTLSAAWCGSARCKNRGSLVRRKGSSFSWKKERYIYGTIPSASTDRGTLGGPKTTHCSPLQQLTPTATTETRDHDTPLQLPVNQFPTPPTAA